MTTDLLINPPKLPRPATAAKLAAGIARHPRATTRRAAGATKELAKIAAGRSDVTPAKRDRRFADPGWEGNFLLRRVLQTYLTIGGTVDGLIDDARLDWRAERQARFAATNVLDALAPSNFPLSNPAVLKATIDEGGANLLRGARRFAADFPGLPSTVDTSRFGVGENLALTPGAVITRTDVYELIEYAPQTETVREVPLLFIPPTINKFYVLDLAPGRSMVEYLVRQGQRVFMVSWRNPGDEHGHFDFDTYAAAILEARAAVARRTRQKAVHINAACSGGILSAAALGAAGTDGVASLTLLVCALDNEQAGTASAIATKELATLAVAESARRGYVDGRALAGVFTWLRPNDLVWNYVVNNYLLGKTPPAFDVLFWNQDTVRLAAGLHRDFVKLALENALTRPGDFTTLGRPVDLSSVTVDSYLVAGVNDHIVPWENAARSAELLGGDTRFVLASSGHIQALVNPPAADSRSSYRIGDTDHRGSWWTDYDAWLAERSGAQRPVPTVKPGAKAPGTYVHAS